MSGSNNASLLIDAFPVVQKLTTFDWISSTYSTLCNYFGSVSIGGLRSKEQRPAKAKFPISLIAQM